MPNFFQPIQSALTAVNDRMPGGTQTVTTGPKPVDPVLIARAIAGLETGGVKTDPYSYSKPSGSRAMGLDMGKYQVTGGELGSYGKQFLGATTSPSQFMASSTLQDRYMQSKIAFLRSQGLSDDDILALHAQGMTGWGNPGTVYNKVQQANATRNNYVTRGDRSIQELLGQSTSTPSGGQ